MWQTLKNSFDILLHADPVYALLALALYVSSYFVIGFRWKLMIEALGGRVHFLQTTLANLTSIFVNNVTPASRLGGEACRITLIRDREHIDFKTATISSLYDRLSELPPILILLAISIPALGPLAARANKYLLIGILILAVIILPYAVYKVLPRLQDRLRILVEKLRSVRLSKKTFSAGVGLSTLLWLEDMIRLMVVAAAFGVFLTPVQAATLVILTIFGGLVPTVGGLGAIEGGLVAGLVLFGVNVETALAITALERSISYAFGTITGGTALAFMGGTKLWKATKSPSL